MWSSRLFWKLFGFYTILNFLATIIFVVIVSAWQEEQLVEQIKHRLEDSAALVRSDVLRFSDHEASERLQTRVRELGRVIQTRITLIDMDGDVLADSTQSTLAQVSKMENHKDRLELVLAASEGHGTSRRVSPTLGEPMLYVALRLDSGDEPIGLVRTAVPMTAVLKEVAAVQRLVGVVGIVVSMVVATVTWFLAARVVRPVHALTSAAEAIADGQYRQNVFLHNHDELDDLAKSFNRMAKQLNVRETQLRESSRRLVTVLEGMVEGVIALDDRERIVLANSAAGRLLSFDPAEATGRPLLEVARHRAFHRALTFSDGTDSQHVEVELGDEHDRVIGVNSARLSTEHTTRCILVLHDVTKLRRLESLRQDFVANVSHELKTPLSSIKAYAETLLNGALSDTNNNRRFLARIGDQADRLHELILDLLSIARIESGKQAFKISAVELARVVQDCIVGHEVAADSRSIRLISGGDPADLLASADEEGLRQILNNLIDNAIKYSPDTGTVTVTWFAEDAMAVIQVRDTGQGIPAEYLPRVFERFFRVDQARSRELGGTGLGLSIVKHLAQSFGGEVHVESRLGEGTVFTVRLPLPHAQADASGD